MPPIPPQLYTRLAAIVVSTVVGTVGPFVLQNRPGLRWVFDRAEGRIVQRVLDRLPTPLAPPEPVETPSPERYDDGVAVPYQACIHPRAHEAPAPLVNPNGYCRAHWWTAGPVRAVVSAPFRLFRALRRGCR